MACRSSWADAPTKQLPATQMYAFLVCSNPREKAPNLVCCAISTSTTGEYLTCRLGISNVGNVPLAGVNVLGQPGCGSIQLLTPSASTSCVVGWLLTQDDFVTWDLQIAQMAPGSVHRTMTVVGATNTALAPLVQAVAMVDVPLVSQPKLTISYGSFVGVGRTGGCSMPNMQGPPCGSQGSTRQYAILPGESEKFLGYNHAVTGAAQTMWPILKVTSQLPTSAKSPP